MGEGLSSFVLVTGMSGAGRTTALKALEDVGFYCIDNLPVPFLREIASYCKSSGKKDRVAVGLQILSSTEVEDFICTLEGLRELVEVRLIFLEAEDGVLLRRFKETRRFHPLMKGSILESIEQERRLLEPVKRVAWQVIDTSNMNSYALRRLIFDLFYGLVNKLFQVSITSFGFKYGIPSYIDMLFDVRCLPNPYYEESLRDLDGRDERVKRFVFSDDGRFLELMWGFVKESVLFLRRDGRLNINIGVGCTGGVHRSVAVAEWLGNNLLEEGYRVSVYHRELGQYKNLLGASP